MQLHKSASSKSAIHRFVSTPVFDDLQTNNAQLIDPFEDAFHEYLRTQQLLLI